MTASARFGFGPGPLSARGCEKRPCFDAIPEKKNPRAEDFLGRRDHPERELKGLLGRDTGVFAAAGRKKTNLQKIDQGSALDPKR